MLASGAMAIGCGDGAALPPQDAAAPDTAINACDQPALDEETLGRLTMSIDNHVAMRPGEERTFELGVVECCYFIEPVDACATFSVTPATGARIDERTGLLTIDAATAHGTRFDVTANVEDGRRLVSLPVYVYTEAGNPLFGIWREAAQIDCQTGAEITPEQAIQELWFRADGSVNVTWFPFEIYVDYWASYTYDLAAGTLGLTVTGGNYVPGDIDGEGTFSLAPDGSLLLRDMWLGTPRDGTAPPRCGHRFVR